MPCTDNLDKELREMAEKECRQRQNANHWALLGAIAGGFLGGVAVVIAILFKIMFLDGRAPEFGFLFFVFITPVIGIIALCYKYGWENYKKPL